MGDGADMVLDGSRCGGCGAYMGEGQGFPRYCSKACDPFGFSNPAAAKSKPGKDLCPHCNKLVAPGQSRRAHILSQHPEVVCPHCSKICKSADGLAHHITAKHPDIEKKRENPDD